MVQTPIGYWIRASTGKTKLNARLRISDGIPNRNRLIL